MIKKFKEFVEEGFMKTVSQIANGDVVDNCKTHSVNVFDCNVKIPNKINEDDFRKDVIELYNSLLSDGFIEFQHKNHKFSYDDYTDLYVSEDFVLSVPNFDNFMKNIFEDDYEYFEKNINFLKLYSDSEKKIAYTSFVEVLSSIVKDFPIHCNTIQYIPYGELLTDKETEDIKYEDFETMKYIFYDEFNISSIEIKDYLTTKTYNYGFYYLYKIDKDLNTLFEIRKMREWWIKEIENYS